MTPVAAAAAGAALGVVLAGGAGYAVGAHSERGTVHQQRAQIQTCGRVSTSLQRSLNVMLQAFEAGDDTGKLAAASQAQDEEGAQLRSEFGTDHVPTIVHKCTGG